MAQSDSERLQRILDQPSSISRLEQLCGLFGWGRKIFYDAESGWIAQVTCGKGETYRIETHEHHERTKKGEKAGRAAAAAQAVKELQPLAERTLAQAPVALEDVFDSAGFQAEIRESCPSIWSDFWAALNAREAADGGPRAVGVGTEGNDGQGPPKLVQVALQDIVILELPRQSAGGGLSPELVQLLSDATVTKVFCDSAAHKDIHSLGLRLDSPGVVELEQLATDLFGKTSASRGLAKIAGLALGKRVEKGNAKGWAEFERSSAASIFSSFSKGAKRYAAMEAYGALRTWKACRHLTAAGSDQVVQLGVSKDRGAVRKRPATSSVREDRSSAEIKEKRNGDGGQDNDLRTLDEEIRLLEEELHALDGPADASNTSRTRKKKTRKKSKCGGDPDPGARRSDAAEKKWAGWKRALDEELQAAGGALPWKQLRDALVARRRLCGQLQGLNEEELGLRALACVPEAYLSRKDDVVRLQKEDEQR